MTKRPKSNLDILKACNTPHRFKPINTAIWKCDECGGEVSEASAMWYHLGFEHGAESERANPDPVPNIKFDPHPECPDCNNTLLTSPPATYLPGTTAYCVGCGWEGVI